MGKSHLTLILLIAAFLAGGALGGITTWTLAASERAQAEVLEGVAWVNDAGTALGLSPDGSTPGPSYAIGGALWREPAGSWHDTFPTCLEPLTIHQRVRLGVVHARVGGNAPERPIVVWLECLD